MAWTSIWLLTLSFYLVHCNHIPSGGGNELDSNGENYQNANDDDMKLVCYYGSWAVYRPGNGKFPVEEIDPFLCSHIIYGFAGLSYDNKIKPLDAYNDLKENWGKGAYLRFNALKQINKKLKTIIAIGGWNEGSVKYSNMASNSESRKTFVESVVEFLDKYGFDGLDFDWEYPGSRGGKFEDKRNFVLLLKELKEAFQPKNYILTSAVSAGKAFADPAYDIPQVAKYLDIINVMCYDYHGGWESRTGHNAPLYARPNEYDDERLLNVNFSINYWISKGAPRNKIVLGMGTYGRSFALQNEQNHDLGASAPQKGQAGPYTREAGSLGYNEICEMKMRNSQINEVWDPYHLAPYAYWGRQWVGYDNIESITIKAKYAKAMGLAGGMIWSVETDDFKGICGDGKYPLLNAIKRVFQEPTIPELPKPNTESNKQPISTPPTQRPSTSSTTPRPPPPTQRPSTLPTTSRPSPSSSQRPSSLPTTSKIPDQTQTKPSPFPTNKPQTFPTTESTKPPCSASNSPNPTVPSENPWTPATQSTTLSPWWPHKPSTWWPTKPTSEVSASSKTWWSSAPSHHNPNSIVTEETTPKPSLENENQNFTCPESGLYRNPSMCTKFIRCLEMKIEGQFQLFFHECPDRTVFNNETKLCDWVENVPECLNSVPKYFLRGMNVQINKHQP